MAERWNQIEEAFHGALNCEPRLREAYLRDLCGDDQDLLREVTTLISCYEKPDDFLEKPQLTMGLTILGTQDSELTADETIGPYTVSRKIGRGGMGDVYLARDGRLGRQVALKLLPRSFEDDPGWVSRFQQEARAASNIAHPNIAHIYEVGEYQGRHYIAMEYIDGETLRERLTRREPLAPKEAVDIIIQVAQALTAAHAAGILHRDIKPENLMIHRDGYVKVLDFGLAKSTTDESQSNGQGLLTSVTTAAGIIVGSPAYMSPEQARGFELDGRTDLWSLGVVFYELLTLTNPFLSETTSDTIAAILMSDPPLLRRILPGPAEEAQAIISRLLAKAKEDRYSDALTLLADLGSLSELSSSRVSAKSYLPAKSAAGNQSIATSAQETRLSFGRIPAYVLGTTFRTKLSLALLGLLIVATITIARYARFSTRPTPSAAITSVAILPFANESGGTDSQYLSDGLSESLIERLSRVSRFKVIARGSSFRFRDKSAELKQVASDLAVQAIVTGTLSKEGDNVNVSVALVDPYRMITLWSGRYHYKTSELPIIVNDVSRKVAIKLNPTMGDDDLNLISRSKPGDGNAYDWYLKGRYYWNKLTEEDLDKSIECFNQAVAIDPENALAYAGLANSYITLGAAFRTSEDLSSKAELNAQKALALDGNLAEAHYAMAATRYIYQWNLGETEKELKRSLELNPNFAMADSLFSSLCLTRGDLAQATAHINRALDLDPFSLLFVSRLSYIYYCQRDTEKQVKLIQSFLNRDPNASLLYNDLAVAYSQMGRFNDALAASQRAMVLTGRDPDALSTLGVVYALAGKSDEAKWVANSLKDLSNTKYVPPYLVARVYSALGDKDQAFRWLDRAVQQHDSYILRVRVESVLDDLRTDARYNKLIQSLNFS